MRPRIVVLLACSLAWFGCQEDRLTTSGGGVRFTASDPVDFGSVTVGDSSVRNLSVGNGARSSRWVKLSSDSPFALTAEFELRAGEERTVSLTFRPEAQGEVQGVLTLQVEGAAQELALIGRGQERTTCAASNPCRRAALDPAMGACIEAPVADGTACEAPCIKEGACVGGECRGQALSCDDGNVCTVDACDVATGQCVNTVQSCAPPDNPCLAGGCDPMHGCISEAVADGTPCGTSNCVTARICMSGACVEQPHVPDGTACRDDATGESGRCADEKCIPPPMINPAWRWSGGGGNLAGLAADENGNVYVVDFVYDQALKARDFFLTSLSPLGSVRFRVAVPRTPTIFPWFKLMVVGAEIVVAWHGNVAAFDANTGSALWHTNIAAQKSSLVLDPSACVDSEWMQLEGLLLPRADRIAGTFFTWGSQTCAPIDALEWAFELDAASGALLSFRSMGESLSSKSIVDDAQRTLTSVSAGSPTIACSIEARSGTGALLWRQTAGRFCGVIAAYAGRLVIWQTSPDLDDPPLLESWNAATGTKEPNRAIAWDRVGDFHGLALSERQLLLVGTHAPSCPQRSFGLGLESLRFDADARWCVPLTSVWYSWSEGPFLTSTNTVVVATGEFGSPYVDTTRSNRLRELSLDGVVLSERSLGGDLRSGLSSAVLVNGAIIGITGSGRDEEVVAFDVPGLELAQQGWVMPTGTSQRTWSPYSSAASWH